MVIPQNHREDRMFTRQDVKTGYTHLTSEPPGILIQPVAQIPGLGQQVQHFNGCTDNRGCQRIGEEEGARALAKKVHDLTAGSGEQSLCASHAASASAGVGWTS